MVVVGVLFVLLALLLPALKTVRNQGHMAASTSNLRQIAGWMHLYSKDNRETIVPSQFDYRDLPARPNPYPGKVRSEANDGGFDGDPAHQGTWADILWTENKVGRFPEGMDYGLGHDYSFQVPDAALYEAMGYAVTSVFRSAAKNGAGTVGSVEGDLPRPYGPGAAERGLPGYFAANDFFNARWDAPNDADGNPPPSAGRWYSTGQIRGPDRALYLVDSFAGYTIAPDGAAGGPWDNVTIDPVTGRRGIEVDFRYSGAALMLLLDGHVRTESPWETLCDLECYDAGACGCGDIGYRNRGLRITDPTRR